MNCDQVFDVLTRGPYCAASPDGQASSLERHLSACHECRRMAEALRPAVALFHEALPAAESRGLPAFHGGLEAEPAGGNTLPIAVAAAIRAAAQAESDDLAVLQSGGSAKPPIRRGAALWQAVVLAATALVIAAAICVIRPVNPRAGAELALHDDALEIKRDGLSLDELQLPHDCTSAAVEIESGAAAARSYSCCTKCHAAGKGEATRLAPSHLTLVAQSCGVCHSL